MTHTMAPCQGKHESRGLSRALGIAQCQNPDGSLWIHLEQVKTSPLLVLRTSAPQAGWGQQNVPLVEGCH